MTGILPNTSAGGLSVQDGAGNPSNPPNVTNVYVPPAPFTFTCTQTALPNDCTAVIEEKQINALMSELICIASIFDPDGVWTCTDVCNTGTAITAWLTGTGPDTLFAAINALGFTNTFSTMVDNGDDTYTWTSADGLSIIVLDTAQYTASVPVVIDAAKNITLDLTALTLLLP